jgi:hypothetical protein
MEVAIHDAPSRSVRIIVVSGCVVVVVGAAVLLRAVERVLIHVACDRGTI